MMRNQFAPHVDFTEFQGLIKSNPKFLPSNLDMIIERNGKFLVAEWKREKETMPFGQELLLKRLAANNFIVLVIVGDNGTNVSSFSKVKESGDWIVLGRSIEELKDFIKGWYEWASAFKS
jgi:hypothetical protein